MTTPDVSAGPRVPQVFWIGLVACVVYVALAAGVANLLGDLFGGGSEAGDFALTHYTVLPVLIVGGLLFLRWSGWWAQTWSVPSAGRTQPRRWWMLSIPVLLLAQSVIVLAIAPWGAHSVGTIVVVLVGTAMVGFGEELFFRGILRVSVRAHHGELVTLLVTSALFGAAHVLGSVIAGLQPAFILLQVTTLAMDGALYYGVVRATGRLWIAMALHALTDFSLYVSGSDVSHSGSTDANISPANVVIQFVLGALSLVLVISCIRQDLLERRRRREATTV
ncbi:CPBP family intramembrane glutamic endopeptidase [Leifsonia sp. NPDC058194]|uniref:CPBP family intramembrane glutamic endopeptidase n=1 Tax=Leifsonia sp. NPDC058194 TaxID=3346374 RepID=UPI0036DBDBD3